MSIKYKAEAKLLSAESNSFTDSDSGKSILYHRVRLNYDGEIYPCKADEAQVKALASDVGKEGIAEVELASRKEQISLRFVSFKAGK